MACCCPLWALALELVSERYSSREFSLRELRHLKQSVLQRMRLGGLESGLGLMVSRPCGAESLYNTARSYTPLSGSFTLASGKFFNVMSAMMQP